MTKVVFKEKGKNLISFKINGHTGYDDIDKDIVCSAISALSCGIGDGIIEILKISPEYHMKDGFLSMSFEKVPIKELENAQALLHTLLLGLKNIELKYSDYIKVKVEEV
jgi:uncharacterized protein